MTSEPQNSLARAGRRCHRTLDALHSTVYFSPDLVRELAALGVHDPVAPMLLTRAALLGPVGPGPATAALNGFRHELVARFLPGGWEGVSPEEILAARLRAADATLRRLLGEECAASPELAEAARLALAAAEGCERAGRPLYAAAADLPVPQEPHLAYWHAAGLLREHRGDGHVAALLAVDLDPLEAMVSHTATGRGMVPDLLLATRGWQRADWEAAQDRLRGRGLLDAKGELTEEGVRLREELEELTDRIGRRPYERLGAAGVQRLTELGHGLLTRALAAGAYPADAFGKG